MTKSKTTARSELAKSASDIIVYGLDKDKKPRAGRFAGRDADLIAKAAQAMSLETYVVGSSELAEIAAKLPAGRLHAQGRAFVAYIRQDLYAKLTDAIGKSGSTASREESAVEPGSTVTVAAKPEEGVPASAALPRTWQDIASGHMVLVHEGPADGWWECIVLERNGDMLTLRARDYPKYPKFVQHLTAVALVYPPAIGT